MSRKYNIQFIIEAIWVLEEADVSPHVFWEYTDEELEKEAEWYEHLLNK